MARTKFGEQLSALGARLAKLTEEHRRFSRKRFPLDEAVEEPESSQTPEVTSGFSASGDYACLYALRDKFHDVIFQLDNGKKILAHRIVLVAQSEFFSVMFNSSFTESNAYPTVINMQDNSERAVELFVKFFYFGDLMFSPDGELKALVNNKDDVVFELIKLTDRYNLTQISEDLANLVIHYMNNATPEDAINTLIRAYEADCITNQWIFHVAYLLKKNQSDQERQKSWTKLFDNHQALYITVLEKAVWPLL